MVFGLVIVAALATAAVWGITIIRRLERRSARHRLPPLVYPLSPTFPLVPPTDMATMPRAEAAAPIAVVPAPEPAAPIAVVPPPAPAAPSPRPFDPRTDVELPIAAAAEPEATVRFRRPTEDAVQLLPGHLEVLAGEPHHKEIRFVRRPGERPEVILGREYSESPGHIALQSTTVSRRHARLAYANGEWKVANLSQTNPVVVNDEALAAGNGERTLADGDCLELGEVVLRFHAR
jgi:hypothetical protein